jgi:5-(carboxyamino)imidazole ribonucleotide synthase
MTDPLPPGSVIGILGGGQLGRMLAIAASRLGFLTHIYEPGYGCPASHVAARTITAAYDDTAALTAFARGVDVVTYEFENIPPDALDVIEAIRAVRPGRQALAVSRDRLTEKSFLQGLGLRTAPFAPVDGPDTLAHAIDSIGLPAILKTRTMGYDGKGQMRISDPALANAALDALNTAPCILEGFVTFTREVSVIAARGLDGAVAAYDPGENVHEGGILRTTTVPARISAGEATDAVLIAARILNALDYVGVMGVELFVTSGGLIVNEIAPRVHNSGHWTQNGCVVDQFEQHIRAVAGWPLGDGTRQADVVMENLIGDDVLRLPALAAENAALHMYGKGAPRPGRKMGHVNRVLRG